MYCVYIYIYEVPQVLEVVHGKVEFHGISMKYHGNMIGIFMACYGILMGTNGTFMEC